ncbi:SDR family NAD(P)-dependent oxidoreductase [Candidatus Berkiella cookevillensis]|uniref:Levodione reductase n=1 Tax=Candidatus Berkiella cookevillensis TaxID=437022 RepID=A0A0Q9YGF6_9GAMM|nr:SDR family NAD(P)-dependent oxidoreductase [Candidatus Berkiella cookevillensis]MCS5707625.1 SDR family NAD(P)-dependent oxidoreductase [Candidatus Berkiella cookevillensis]
MNIKDQVVLVSGGGSGMGETLCHSLAQQNATIIVLDRHAENAHRVAKAINGIALVCDITDEKALEDSIHGLAIELQTKLKVVVNCAGIAPAQRMVGKKGPVALEWFEQVIKVNLIGTFNVMRLAAHLMIQNATEREENGVIINTASIAAFDGQIGQSAYSASKGGVVAMTLPLARELAQFGIRVMTIAPGLINTPMLQGMPDAVTEALISQTVYPKRFGETSEYAKLVAHIIDNPMLNGEVIRLDGAMRMA